MPQDQAAVVCDGLQIRYGDKIAVNDLSFGVCAGEVVAILGPNGAGKTSTVETIEGYRRPSGGSVRVLGFDPIRDHRNVVSRIGVMLQKGGIYPTMTPGQVIRLFSQYYDDPESPSSLISMLGLDGVARTPWRRLSGGEQQRVSLALALVGRPDVCFLDEPTAGVDPEGRLTIRGVIRGLRERGAAVLLATHELAEAERVADRVIVMSAGRAIASGTVSELAGQTAAGSGVFFETRAEIDRSSLGVALGLAVDSVFELSPGSYRLACEGTPDLVAALTSWLASNSLTLLNLRTGGASLEDVYLSLVGSDGPVSAGSAGSIDSAVAGVGESIEETGVPEC